MLPLRPVTVNVIIILKSGSEESAWHLGAESVLRAPPARRFSSSPSARLSLSMVAERWRGC